MARSMVGGARRSLRQELAITCCAAILPVSLATGCGHTETEWRAQMTKQDELVRRDQNLQQELARAKAEVERLTTELSRLGVDLNSERARAGDLQRHLEAAKQQAALLERVRVSFETLRERLKELMTIGLEVSIRHNKMVVTLPGDVLFAPGSEKLSKSGEQALTRVRKVLQSDAALAERYYQVAGHTDNQPLLRTVEVFKDNWGLSLMRAREVLLFLTKQEPGANLNVKRWAAAGYAETDPVGSNASPEGRRRNRRVELVLQPKLEEMLDLNSLVQQPQ